MLTQDILSTLQLQEFQIKNSLKKRFKHTEASTIEDSLQEAYLAIHKKDVVNQNTVCNYFYGIAFRYLQNFHRKLINKERQLSAGAIRQKSDRYSPDDMQMLEKLATNIPQYDYDFMLTFADLTSRPYNERKAGMNKLADDNMLKRTSLSCIYNRMIKKYRAKINVESKYAAQIQ